MKNASAAVCSLGVAPWLAGTTAGITFPARLQATAQLRLGEKSCERASDEAEKRRKMAIGENFFAA